MLKGEKLYKSYGKRLVVGGVCFEVKKGEIVGLLGKNGAGKTTTFRITVGLLKPDKGKIFFQDHDITNYPMYKRARLGIGYLAQEPSIFRFMNVEDNLVSILQMRGYSYKKAKDKIIPLLEGFGLEKIRKSKGYMLSGGERRRLEIARTLLLEPSIILLDEPFSGVDPITVSEIKKIIISLKQKGIGILLTDHNVRETLTTTDRAYIILDGKIIAHGTPEEIIKNPHVRETYLGKDFVL